MKKILSIFITFLIIVLVVIFFATIQNNENNKMNNSKIKVITTLFPEYDFVKQIGKDKIEVELLLKPGTEPHTYDPSPKDIININSSDLFIYTGKYMEPWAESIASSINGNVNILDASNGIKYIKEEHDHDDEDEHEEHEHEYDPHIWLDISNAKIMVDNILETLINIDKGNADYYIQNADEYKEKLDKLDNDFYEVILNAKRNVICFGDKFAYIYFIERYNLDYISAYDGCSANAEPSVSKIFDIENAIKKENIPVIFYDSMSSGTVAKSIAKDTNIKALVFSTVHNVSNENLQKSITYVDIMEQNLNSLKIALN